MADGDKADWGAGILAIVAALLFGAGLPIGLYYGVYKPKIEAHQKLKAEAVTLDGEEQKLINQQTKIGELKEDSKLVEGKLVEVESSFSTSHTSVISHIRKLAKDNRLEAMAEKDGDTGTQAVKLQTNKAVWAEGLEARKVRVRASGTYHDFGRFMAAVEGMENTTIIPRTLEIDGDASTGNEHQFTWEIYIVVKRDIDKVGRKGQQ